VNEIHPTAQIGTGVEIGENNVIGPYTVITGNTVIGNHNWLGPHVVIGTPPQHRDIDHLDSNVGNSGRIEIGNNNIIREFVTIQSPTLNVTSVGNNVFLMTQAHIPHDAVIEDFVTIANSSHLAGHVRVCIGANIGLGVVVHQYLVIGALAMIGMGSVVTRNVRPFALAFGSPCKQHGINIVGISRMAESTGLNVPSVEINDWDEFLINKHYATEISRYEHLLMRR
jgi:UDP-N-acetylglucosamine acyltransferase